jgi:translation initiation factor 5A
VSDDDEAAYIEYDEDSQVSAGASQTYLAQVSGLSKGGYVCIKGHPCQVVDLTQSEGGAHLRALVHITGVDVFTGESYRETVSSNSNVHIPLLKRTDYSLLDITDDGYLSLLTSDGSTKDDLKVPEGELGGEVRSAVGDGRDVVIRVLAAMGQEAVVSVKETGVQG